MAGERRGRLRYDLDAKKVKALIRKETPGRFFDGGGLHLFIKRDGGASWVLRVTANGRRRDFGLGGADIVSLAEAREAARQYRAIARRGGDPLEEKRKRRTIPTFEEVARSVHAEHSGSWRNAKHAKQWISTLEMYAFPEIGSMRVDLIGMPEILKVLQPIWQRRPETARRVRQRIRTVLDVAHGAGHRATENPVGASLAKALPKQTAKPRHHTALPFGEVPAFFHQLGDTESATEVPRLALQFLILTATRTNETIGARRAEFDLESKIWTIPHNRMKAGLGFKVPLCNAAVSIVRRALDLGGESDLVFPGVRAGKPLSNMALLMVCRRLGVQAVPHGFRSSFRDWAAEATSFPTEVAEMALAHAIGNKTEAAYRRGDLFDKRRKLMDAWAAYTRRTPAEVVRLRRRAP
jgi:integrase